MSQINISAEKHLMHQEAHSPRSASQTCCSRRPRKACGVLYTPRPIWAAPPRCGKMMEQALGIIYIYSIMYAYTVYIYIYIYLSICVCKCVYVYIYIYIQYILSNCWQHAMRRETIQSANFQGFLPWFPSHKQFQWLRLQYHRPDQCPRPWQDPSRLAWSMFYISSTGKLNLHRGSTNCINLHAELQSLCWIKICGSMTASP